jgi:hypothetical protein
MAIKMPKLEINLIYPESKLNLKIKLIFWAPADPGHGGFYMSGVQSDVNLRSTSPWDPGGAF